MNYKIIKDKKLLKDFIDWLPELKPTEQYYCCLFARSKYTKDEEGNNSIVHIKSDKGQLKRFTSDKQRLLSKIKQLECPIGSYMQRDIPIPQEALALYISVNPRDLWKATQASLIHFSKMVVSNSRLANPQQEAMSEIQKNIGTKHYRVFDLDTKDADKLLEVESYLSKDSYKILETKGGYHILVQPKLIEHSKRNTWFKKISSMKDIDKGEDNNDMMCPVPGCTQGNFIPHFI